MRTDRRQSEPEAINERETAMTDTDKIKQELRQFIFETFFFGDESESFENSDSFMQKGIIDSTGVLELISFLEEKYGITVDDSDMVPDNLDSIDNLIGYLQSKTS